MIYLGVYMHVLRLTCPAPYIQMKTTGAAIVFETIGGRTTAIVPSVQRAKGSAGKQKAEAAVKKEEEEPKPEKGRKRKAAAAVKKEEGKGEGNAKPPPAPARKRGKNSGRVKVEEEGAEGAKRGRGACVKKE